MSFESTFKDKVCVITGAGSGIGRALALRLNASGAILALSDIDAETLAETQALIGSDTNAILYDSLDVSDADAIVTYSEKVQTVLGPADYVFNVAGVSRVGTFEASPLSSLEIVMNVNFYGVVRMSKAFLGQLKETHGGLVNISSVFGIIGFPGQVDYCASKFAVRGFSETLAQEVEHLGIRVSCVHPGGVTTNISRNAVIDKKSDPNKSREEMEAQFDKVAITSPEKAADIILTGTAKGKRQILVGGDARLVQIIARLFPTTYFKVMRRLQPEAYDIL